MALQNNMEYLNKLLDEIENEGNKTKWLKVDNDPDKTTDIRLLPMDEKTLFMDYQHWGITERPVSCLKTWGKKCPICEKLWNVGKLPKEQFKKKSRMLSQKRVLLYVLKINFAGGETVIEPEPYIWSTNDGLLQYVLKTCMPKGIDLVDPVKGKILSLSRSAKGNKIEKIPMGELDISKVLEKVEGDLTPFNEIITEPDEDYMNDVLKKLDEKLESLKGVTVNVENNGVKKDVVGDAGVGGNITNPIERKREQIFQQTGLKIQDGDIVKCFGLHGQTSNCGYCEYAIACEEYSSINKKDSNEMDDAPF